MLIDWCLGQTQGGIIGVIRCVVSCDDVSGAHV